MQENKIIKQLSEIVSKLDIHDKIFLIKDNDKISTNIFVNDRKIGYLNFIGSEYKEMLKDKHDKLVKEKDRLLEKLKTSNNEDNNLGIVQ